MLKHLAIIFGLLMASALYVGHAVAGDTSGDVAVDETPFVKKRYNIKGTASVETVDGETHLVFSKDFKTKSGPDLKIYLSKIEIDDLSASDVDKNAIRLSVLKSHRGAQRYKIPKNIDLSDYESVVIQCEAYTVLWGGFDL